MNNIPISIEDPGFDFLAIFICGGIAVVGLLLVIFLTIMGRNAWNWRSNDVSLPWFLLLYASMALAYIGVSVAANAYKDETEAYRIAAIEEAGFTDVSFSEDSFTANRDGEYFKGTLADAGDRKWLIVEVP